MWGSRGRPGSASTALRTPSCPPVTKVTKITASTSSMAREACNVALDVPSIEHLSIHIFDGLVRFCLRRKLDETKASGTSSLYIVANLCLNHFADVNKRILQRSLVYFGGNATDVYCMLVLIWRRRPRPAAAPAGRVRNHLVPVFLRGQL